MKALLRKITLITLLLPILGFFLSSNTYALKSESSLLVAATPIKDGIDKSKETTGMGDEGSDADVNNIVQTVITFLIWLVGVLAVIMIIYGGILYTTSGGDPSKTKKGKDTILYGIVGLVIAILAFVIVNFVINVVTPT